MQNKLHFFMSMFFLLVCCVFLQGYTAYSLLAQESGIDVLELQKDRPSTPDEIMKQRQEIATKLAQETSVFTAQNSTINTNLIPDAIELDPALLITSNLSGDSSGMGIFNQLGVIKPQQGDSFLLLSSGIAGSLQPEPGTDLFGDDKIQLSLTISIPVGISQLGFSYSFLSAEYPDFVGSTFNDTFTALISDRNGIREVARSSVNSSVFAPASASNAGGSGFDLFTSDPSGVDLLFEGGYPDAGVTGFSRVNIDVAGGQQINLIFAIEDRGDSILDSAVILDNLSLSSIELVDPNPNFLQNGEIINTPEVLAQGGRIVEGAASDGVTRILLRGRAPFPGVAEFCLKDGKVDIDGGLTEIGQMKGQNTCIKTSVFNTPKGLIAYAIYQTPHEFNGENISTEQERLVSVLVKFTSTAGDIIETETEIKLVRPSVILIHGLWSNSETWTFDLVRDSRFHVVRADYKATNATHFSTNLYVPLQFVGVALQELRAKGIAATQVDIAGHSMGGILIRNYIASPKYKRNNNYNAGDIRKVFTLNTPHTGSPLGNLAVELRDDLGPIKRLLLLRLLKELGHPIDEGAIDDLAKGSSAINAIQYTEVPSHAFVGTGGSDLIESSTPDFLTNIPGPIGQMYTIINFFTDASEIFPALQHDGIVGRQSQEGGLPANAYSIYGGMDTIHTSVTSYKAYSDRLIELLNTPTTKNTFAYFPAPATLPLVQVASLPSLYLNDEQSSLSGITITTPLNGESFATGSTITVTIEPPVDIPIDKALLVGPSYVAVDNDAPFVFNLTLPIDYVGNYPLFATGGDSINNLYGSNPVTITVLPAAILQSLDLAPNELLLTEVGEKRSLLLMGNYSDGISRALTSPSAGTIYLTSDPEVITVSPDGIITAMKSGRATVIALNNNLQDSISVQVYVPNELPIADAGSNQIADIGAIVTLNGSASYDPDVGPGTLAYEWFQLSGPSVILSDPTSIQPSFVTDHPGRYIFSLIVRDGQDDSTPDQVIVDVAITDVAVEIDASNLISPGENISYTITYFNQGSILATGVVITNIVPVFLTNVSFTSIKPIAAIEGVNYIWQIGDLLPSEQEVITVFGTVQQPLPAGTNFNNEIVIRGATLDANTLNNQYQHSFTVRNVRPEAQGDTLQFDEDGVLNGLLTAVDANGDMPSTFAIAIPPTIGELSLSDSSFTYVPPANFNGNDDFTFIVHDSGGLTSTALINIQVLPVNDPPVTIDDTLSVSQNSQNNVLQVLNNDSVEPDVAEILQIVAVSTPSQEGVVSVNLAKNSLIYTPKPGFVGDESFNYTVDDGNGGLGTANVVVTVTSAVQPVFLPLIAR